MRSNSVLPAVSRFLDDDWNSLFDWRNRNFSSTTTTLPSVNVKETGDEFIVEMAAPGMKKDDFAIELHNNVLTIRSEVRNEKEEKEDGKYSRREFSYQSFQRSFNLNNQVVDDDQIEATYEDGILRLVLPKQENAREKPPRHIEIN
ncbi:Hsp20/alpha crystallin family protein [Neolewinella litorea]|uniref:Hsp20/alpha crystallin family protein n=1 Tax=Neolewinella litorea TaxID=2562452 RepID=A0A4S4NG00_9BACT|nr:Hsp20/alpha crystallin family protein [Neolewinella litorea]THH34990.1 Hsp20/alpha crystallin family protein [Neolewinella litorea]